MRVLYTYLKSTDTLFTRRPANQYQQGLSKEIVAANAYLNVKLIISEAFPKKQRRKNLKIHCTKSAQIMESSRQKHLKALNRFLNNGLEAS